MFIIARKTKRIVIVCFDEEMFIFPAQVFSRAGGRGNKQSAMRHSVEITVEGKLYIFTTNEWESSRSASWQWSLGGIPRLIQEEIQEKVKNSKRLGKQRAARIRMEANAMKRRSGSKNRTTSSTPSKKYFDNK